MSVALLGRKVGMTQVFDGDGNAFPVTVIEVGPCHVLQVRTADKDGYDALQLGFDDKPRRTATKPERGHVAKVSCEPKRFVKEVRLDQPATVAAGEVLTVDVFDPIPRVDVVGTMKGRGFTGPMKRHGFSGLEKTHGVLKKHRAAGSIGCNTSPAKVAKNRKMNGQYGNTRKTVRNLKVIRVDKENHLLLVYGGIPGPNGGYVMVRQTNKRG